MTEPNTTAVSRDHARAALPQGHVIEGDAVPTWFDRAREALAQAKSIDEVIDIRDRAEALRVYTKQARQGQEMQNWCAEIKLRRTAGRRVVAGDGPP